MAIDRGCVLVTGASGYLGGLGDSADRLSPHLASRAEVGRVLRESGIPATIFRAATIIGAGSVAFETLFHLVRSLPVMVTPHWVSTRTQPIAIRDVLAYMVGVLERPAMWGHDFDIGGPEIMTYRDMIAATGLEPGKKVPILPVPLLTPRLSAFWIAMFSPVLHLQRADRRHRQGRREHGRPASRRRGAQRGRDQRALRRGRLVEWVKRGSDATATCWRIVPEA